MKERIAQLIAEEKITKAAFAKRIGVSAPFITQLCNGDANPSSRTIADICREFHVRREWLENGEEPMKLPEPASGMEVIDRILENDDDPVVRRVKRWMSGYFRLSPERRKIAASLLEEIERLQDNQ